MTEEYNESELVRHLLQGGQVKNIEHDEVCNFEGFALVGVNDKVNSNVTLEELHEEFEIYMTTDQQRIKELEGLLHKSGSELQKALAKNKDLQPPKRAHLRKEEVKQIEMDFDKGIAIDFIMRTYDISKTVARRIELGKHTHSTKAID